MEKLVVTGGKKLQGTISVSGAKNAALKALVAACLTDEEVVIKNVPIISDIFVMVDIMKTLGAEVSVKRHIARVQMKEFMHSSIPLDKAALARTSVMFIAPLLARTGEAIIPNPGGCRLGARPVDRMVEGIETMNTSITYHSEDGYFHARTSGLKATTYHFPKNTHVGTETMILAAVLASGTTVLTNAAEEPEINDLIALINAMGGKVKRTAPREITIIGVEKLHGATIEILPDRNDIVTFAVAAILTKGDVFIKKAHLVNIDAFLEALQKAGGGFSKERGGIRFFSKSPLKAVDVTTSIHPGFMTDWQPLWAVLMSQAEGTSTIHETVFENKFGYVKDLRRMGAGVKLFNPEVENKEKVYNFNLADDRPNFYHGLKITGPKQLHEGIVKMADIRAGAAVVLAALAARGTSTIFDIDKLDRGYEKFEERMQSLGAAIKREQDN